MSFVVHRSDDAGAAQAATHAFLAAEPARNNVILTLLDERTRHPEPGRYWWITEGTAVRGLAMQSPVTFLSIMTALPVDAVAPLVATIADDAPELPGIVGDAATAATFAGCWTEQLGIGARPVEGQRVYRLGTLRPPDGVPGELRGATGDDLELVQSWFRGFEQDTGMPSPDPLGLAVPRRIADGEIWLWCHDELAVSMTRISGEVAGTVRVGYVYTPPEHRRRGYAAAAVGAASARAQRDGAEGCVLYTQLSNPTSNGVYRRIGFEAIGEVLSYEFLPGPTG
jgi:ribosomal protein S18 acetylase RimI-like enzyme